MYYTLMGYQRDNCFDNVFGLLFSVGAYYSSFDSRFVKDDWFAWVYWSTGPLVDVLNIYFAFDVCISEAKFNRLMPFYNYNDAEINKVEITDEVKTI